MNIEELKTIEKKAATLKNKANDRSDLFKVYLEAKEIYLEAYQYCTSLENISQIHKDFLSTIYLYEALDCEYSYSLKIKDFEKCQSISSQQKQIITKTLSNYNKEDIKEEEVKEWYKYLERHRTSSDFKSFFPIGKSYFDSDNYKKALFYFRRADDILNTTNTSDLNKEYLLTYYLNYHILKFNISQCQVGIYFQEKTKNKAFLERQIIKELLFSIEYANEVSNLSDDPIYEKGKIEVNNLIKDILKNPLNSWQDLFDYNHSNYLLNLMFGLNKNKAKKINSSKTEKKIDYFLFYTHGFNTRGKWKNDLTEVISSKQRDTNINFIQIPWDYGFFVIKFFIKKSRETAINKFVKKYNEILDEYGNCESKCLIAHSFGTYLTSEALQNNPNFLCNKIIYAGNIIDINYDWNKLKNNNQIDKVLIEQSTNDVAVLFAKFSRKIYFQRWIGYAGRDGFSKNYPFIQYIKSKSGHSGMLNKKNMSENWFKFLVG